MHSIQFVSIRQSYDNISASTKEDEFRDSKIKLYKETLAFIDLMKHSRHPNTRCWLLEIMNILTNKFPPPANFNRIESSLSYKMEV